MSGTFTLNKRVDYGCAIKGGGVMYVDTISIFKPKKDLLIAGMERVSHVCILDMHVF